MQKGAVKSLIFFLFIILLYSNSTAQSLEPRHLSDIPVKGNFVFASYGYSKGDILLDPASPVQDLESDLHSVVFAYLRSFKLFNRLAKIDAVVPYAMANFKGLLNGEAASTYRSGFGDPMLRFSIIIIGSEPLVLKDFAKYEPKKFKFGVGLRITPPIGQYDSTKLINLGTNRWTFKMGIGASYIFLRKFILEGQIKSWFFTDNNNFYNGSTISQTPLFSGQIHLTYIFKPGVWISGSLGQTNEGTTYINEVKQEKTTTNTKYGLTFSYRVAKGNSLKIAFTNGVPNQYAIDYTSLIVAYTFLWFDK